MMIMTSEEFLHDQEERINEYIQDAYWNGSFSTEELREMLFETADNDTIIITGREEFDWDTELQDIYDCTEKGLS